MKQYFLYLVTSILFLLIVPAHAYLDPGTGSIILQAILGLFAATVATLSFYWNKVKLFLYKLIKKNNKK